MSRITPLFLLLAFVLSSLSIGAQDLTGIWRGTFYNEYEYLFTGAKYRYEVQIKNVGKALKGVTYSYQTTRFYGKATMIGVWSASSGDVTLKENQMTDLKITGGGDGCLMTCYLSYRKEGSHEYLEGTYSSVNMRNDTIPCGGGVVRLEKVPDSDFELEDFLKQPETNAKNSTKPGVKPGQADFLVKPPATKPPAPAKKPATTGNNPTAGSKTPPPVASGKSKTTPPPAAKKTVIATPKPTAKDTSSKTSVKVQTPITEAKVEKEEKVTAKAPPLKTPPPKVLTTRKNEVVETISTGAKFLEISFYDNGEIDGDTISVYDNNTLLVSRKRLSTEPITIKVVLDENDPMHEVVMVAENLGSIPPNTALMIVQAGAQRFTVRLSSTEQKNAAVRFKYDPDSLK